MGDNMDQVKNELKKLRLMLDYIITLQYIMINNMNDDKKHIEIGESVQSLKKKLGMLKKGLERVDI